MRFRWGLPMSEGPSPRVPDDTRVYAIGDIHGRSDLHEALLRRIVADAQAAGSANNCLV